MTPVRERLFQLLADRALAIPPAPVAKVAISGADGAGKTMLANELASRLVSAGRPVIRASIDGFHNPRAVRYRRGRRSPEGFYRDSFNLDELRASLLDPLSAWGSRRYRTAAFDHRADAPVDMPWCVARPDAVLIIDGIFLLVDVLRPYWDLAVFLDVPFEETFRRMAARDGADPNPLAEANRRYREGQILYFEECRPQERAHVLIDYADVDYPVVLRA